MELVLTKNFNTPESWTIGAYEKAGGYQAVRKALQTPQDQVVGTVKDSGLRGRGGAGFPAGMKWSFVPKNTGKPSYLCVNSDESEPGTFKDRSILEKDPHLLVEGTMIAAYAINARVAYIYIRGEFDLPRRRLEAALQEARQKNYLGKKIFGTDYDLEIYVHRGAGAY